MEYLYLWGIGQKGLIVLGPYEGENDHEYQRRRTILVAGGVTPNNKWLGTRDQAAATQIIKHGAMGVTGHLETGTDRARHDIKIAQQNNTTVGEDIL